MACREYMSMGGAVPGMHRVMTTDGDFEIFLAAPPGLEAVLAEEARGIGLREPVAVAGGVTVRGSWRDVWRANLECRGAGRVLARPGFGVARGEVLQFVWHSLFLWC